MATPKLACPVHGCAGRGITTYDLRWHFRFLHPQNLVNVPGKDCYPRCDRCGMHVNPAATVHQETKECKTTHAAKLQREEVSNFTATIGHKFFAYREDLDRMKLFKYLGRPVGFVDDDTQAVRGNLKKEKWCWARISCALRSENASARGSRASSSPIWE